MVVFQTLRKREILKKYKPLLPTTHKGIQGHAFVIGGSYGKIGSICLSAKAAIKTGCGLVTVFIPKCGYKIVQMYIPEVMVVTDKMKRFISDVRCDIIPDAIGIGPGLGQELATQKALHEFLKKNKIPLVIDADAINILAKNKTWLPLLPKNTVITPHFKELQRLIGKWNSFEEKIQMAINFATKYQLIIVIKGAPTLIIDGQQVYENTTGNAALATAGSGDVLTGMITSLLAQSYEPIDAAIIGVYLHGLTADIALPKTGFQSFIASDIIANLGNAFLTLDA